ncbi:hypothetical protein [Nitrobacter vulgaris]|uniref:DUF768 domain-containing protein n=1 Tax=Nitrobacter vulgaris TaxID=29421 RepID=A0A1V4HXT7_NITVU|nr:hypothetical protein [Nitrobacter vulgaris]OPH82724.1 hypothetical protein B2M20_10900 [Nitrobacter vulgaris]
MTTPKEYVQSWLDVSVDVDEQQGSHSDHAAVQRSAYNLVSAAREHGFSKEQIEAELEGDVKTYIRASIDRQNAAEDTRLRDDPQ